MKKQMFYALAFSLLLAPSLLAQTPEAKEPAMPDCAAMMQQHDAMKAHMAEMNARLDAMVAEMNKAKGSAKVDKTAAVVTELVAQRSMMQKEMMEMQPKMMEHMMSHMKRGMMTGMANSVSGCPMMKDSDKGSTPAPPMHKH
ncbi:MAG: hypothetical protein WC538_15085 [Thermoanaerobaculia bacterium]|jgi:hypothetical protein